MAVTGNAPRWLLELQARNPDTPEWLREIQVAIVGMWNRHYPDDGARAMPITTGNTPKALMAARKPAKPKPRAAKSVAKVTKRQSVRSRSVPK